MLFDLVTDVSYYGGDGGPEIFDESESLHRGVSSLLLPAERAERHSIPTLAVSS